MQIFPDCLISIFLSDFHSYLSILPTFFFSFDLFFILIFIRCLIDTLGLMMNDTVLFIFYAFSHFAAGDEIHRV